MFEFLVILFFVVLVLLPGIAMFAGGVALIASAVKSAQEGMAMWKSPKK